MRRYETPAHGQCPVTQGAKGFIDHTMDIVNHIQWTIEKVNQMDADDGQKTEALSILNEMKDANLDQVAIVCRLEAFQIKSSNNRLIDIAQQAAGREHIMEHMMGAEKIDSPATLYDPPENHFRDGDVV